MSPDCTLLSRSPGRCAGPPSPESTTKRIPSMVTEVSAMLVERMHFRTPGGATSNTWGRVRRGHQGLTQPSPTRKVPTAPQTCTSKTAQHPALHTPPHPSWRWLIIHVTQGQEPGLSWVLPSPPHLNLFNVSGCHAPPHTATPALAQAPPLPPRPFSSFLLGLWPLDSARPVRLSHTAEGPAKA